MSAPEITAIRNRADKANQSEPPVLLGICHSHPFGRVTELSSTDQETFLSFPYNYEGNVFMLTDPTIGMIRWYVITRNGRDRALDECDWMEIMDQ